MNEKFAQLSFKINELSGTWQLMIACLIVTLVWVACGPLTHFSDTWQLAINTPTTLFELFQGIFVAAAVARVEYRNHQIQQMIYSLLVHEEEGLQQIEVELDRCEGHS